MKIINDSSISKASNTGAEINLISVYDNHYIISNELVMRERFIEFIFGIMTKSMCHQHLIIAYYW